MAKAFLKILPFLVLCNFAFAQNGGIKVHVTDSATKQPLPFANVIVEQGDKQIAGTTTDEVGYAELKPLDPGFYNVRVVYFDHDDAILKNLHVLPDLITFVALQMRDTSGTEKVMIIRYNKNLATNNDLSGSGPAKSSNNDFRLKQSDTILGSSQIFMENYSGNCYARTMFYDETEILMKKDTNRKTLTLIDINSLNPIPLICPYSSFYDDAISLNKGIFTIKNEISLPANDFSHILDFYPLSKLNGSYTR